MIRFSKPSITSLEEKYVLDAMKQGSLSGDGKYTPMVYAQFKERFNIDHMLLTTSGTTALEMAMLLINLQPGDEVIVPSFTFSSTVNAFVLRGAVPVFCDIRTDTMNMDENLIEPLITEKTKAIVTVDYAGVPCEMDIINAVAKKHGLHVIEDAAQAIGSSYKGVFAGKLSEIGCYSFHDTKNYTMGEGGAIVLNDASYEKRADILREKGTNRREAIQGIVDKYTWHDVGSSFLPSDILSALLYAQMERFDEIMEKRMYIWNSYHTRLEQLEKRGLQRPFIPNNCTHNAHMYYVILPDAATRAKAIAYMRSKGIVTPFHYIPLHSSIKGMSFGYKEGMLPNTENYSTRLMRLPLHLTMSAKDIEAVIDGLTSIVM